MPDKSKIFKTEKMAPTIPSNLRTIRYDLYTSGESYSNSSGAIGCLEEMTAYYYGLYASTHLIDYLLQYDDGSGFFNFAVDVANDQCAYVEFRFFILNYLIFARQYFPQTYNYLMASKEFVAAYTEVCEAFEVEIDTVKERLPEINNYLSAHFGAELVMTDQDFSYYRNGNFIKGAPLNDYTLLSVELSKSKYADMESAIKKATGKETTAETASLNPTNTAPSNTTNKNSKLSLSLSKDSDGVLIYISGQEEYDAVMIYRRDSKSSKFKFRDILFTGCSYFLDKSINQGDVSYFIVGLKLVGNTPLTTSSNIKTIHL